MRILLDTHIVLWALTDSPRLPRRAREIISTPSHDIFFSAASLWEIEIKHQAHPDRMLCGASEVAELCHAAGYQQLPIHERHVLALPTLAYDPSAPSHQDSFSRIMLCQAKTDGLIFVTHDELIPHYEEACVLAL